MIKSCLICCGQLITMTDDIKGQTLTLTQSSNAGSQFNKTVLRCVTPFGEGEHYASSHFVPF